MSFGTLKSGANSTDKKLIRMYHKEGWPVDKIAAKLSLKPALVARIVDFNAPAPIDPALSAPIDPPADQAPAATKGKSSK